ncbi:O-antigen ligase family protein [Caenimonas aquaedulcis]|uniref:O-antigen ligase family protein n=1 Tax=Caenimonas aquaedulcis TaxID=2793270 RepID=A0A931H748_9BURK|nr:O-antigen ligase family protein [Caenimonas aquaedulcis]MBG9389831.1 O-antigen ligase family protein [Caenimonas aquaedulcis]
MPQNLVQLLRRAAPPLWLLSFLFLAFHGATVAAPDNKVFLALIITGGLIVFGLEREALRGLWRDNRTILVTSLLLAGAIALSESIGRYHGVAPAHPWPPQLALFLCLPVLAVFLKDARWLALVVGIFCLLCAWHFIAMPVEAVTGSKLSWHPLMLLPRDAGPLHYQASGLAWQAYYFAGLFLPLFYLAWGPVYEKRVFADLHVSRRAMLALALLWLIPAACVQSRSAFAGTLCAALLAIVATSGRRNVRVWFAVGLLAVFAAGIYWQMFAENKSGADLRVAYFKLYVRESLHWPWILTGRSYYLDPDIRMMVPGMIPLQHSHNDISQILYSWGLPGLLAYVAYLAALVRLVWKRFVAHGEVWPACALVVLFPSMVTDLGFQHYEKAVALVLVTALCMALAPKPAPGRPATP